MTHTTADQQHELLLKLVRLSVLDCMSGFYKPECGAAIQKCKDHLLSPDELETLKNLNSSALSGFRPELHFVKPNPNNG